MDYSLLIDAGDYVAKIAETDEEKNGALALRYQELVLAYNQNAEPGGSDFSPYDDYSELLIVVCKATGKTVACMRMTDGSALPKTMPFICEDEFDVTEVKATGAKICEASRAVVASEHRNGTVLMLLFKLVGRYAFANGFRYLMGDVSFFGTDKMALQNQLSLVANKYPLTAFNVPSHDKQQVEMLPLEQLPSERELQREMPPLVRLYAMIGAKFSQEAFTDYPFGSVDLFVLFDTENCNMPCVEKFIQ